MGLITRYAAVGVILFAGYMLMNYVQHRFDEADLKNATLAVRQAQPFADSDQNIDQHLQNKFGVTADQISWSSSIESKVWGTVQVRALVPSGSERLVWTVDLGRQSVTPISPAAKHLGN